jgi:hypothetical protein
MPRNGSGTYTLPIGNPVVTGTTISSTWANNTLTDISNALTGSLSADGQTTASGNLNMGTNRIINLADPQNAQDAATKYYVDQLIAALGTMAYQDANAVAITGGTIDSVSIDLHLMTDEFYLPVGPTSLRTATPIAGLMRWNTDGGGFYEGYNGTTWQKFTTVNQGSYSISYVIVAGGGGAGGNSGGGGGAGGAISNTLTAIPATVFSVTIGAGGAPSTGGSNSFITGIATAVGGGAGSSYGPTNGGAGGSGGGGSGTQNLETTVGGTGTPPQGLSGGGSSNTTGAGGGGGYTSAGASGSFGSGGAGGAGLTLTITGTTSYVAGGGGGAAGYYQSGGGGAGGIGGGGAGVAGGLTGNNGTVNTGGGGGGGGSGTGSLGGNGGSGVVYMSMPTANYTGTITGLPTVTTSGSNTILRFTNSGSYSA